MFGHCVEVMNISVSLLMGCQARQLECINSIDSNGLCSSLSVFAIEPIEVVIRCMAPHFLGIFILVDV